MGVIYFVTFRVYYLGIFYFTKTMDFRINGITEIQSMEHIKQLEDEISKLRKNRKILITNYIKLFEIREVQNAD